MAPFSIHTRQRVIHFFLAVFYGLALYKWINGLFLYQLQPQFFNLRFDPSAWLLMQTGIHQWLLNNPAGCRLFDFAFYGMPLLWWLVWKRNDRQPNKKSPAVKIAASSVMAIVWLLVNSLYVQCYTLYPSNSIEGHIGWLLMPLLFASTRLSSFYFVLHGLRYYFLFFFASAAIWKFRLGGIYNPEQMSGILLYQHTAFLFNAPDSWYSHLVYWVIQHSFAGWLLYAAATALELSFITGFFTRKYDRWLFAGFLLFLVMDLLVMRIPYFELLPLSLPLLFSGYQAPAAADDK